MRENGSAADGDDTDDDDVVCMEPAGVLESDPKILSAPNVINDSTACLVNPDSDESEKAGRDEEDAIDVVSGVVEDDEETDEDDDGPIANDGKEEEEEGEERVARAPTPIPQEEDEEEEEEIEVEEVREEVFDDNEDADTTENRPEASR